MNGIQRSETPSFGEKFAGKFLGEFERDFVVRSYDTALDVLTSFSDADNVQVGEYLDVMKSRGFGPEAAKTCMRVMGCQVKWDMTIYPDTIPSRV